MSNHAGLFLLPILLTCCHQAGPTAPMIVSVSDTEDNLAILPARPFPRAAGTPTQTPQR